EHVTIVEEAVEDPLVTNSRIRSLGNVNIDQAVNMEAEEKKEEADSDLESMPDDEIMSVSGNEDEEADSDRELSVADEIEVDKVIDTLVSIANKEGTDTTIFVASDPTISSALGALQRYKAIQITKALGSDPLGHLPRRMDFLAAYTISELVATMDNHGDGFTEVKSRKANEKMADEKAKMSHISGIRLNKPKPNFYRSKPVKENDHGKGASSMTKEHVTNGSNNIKSRVNFFEALKSLDDDGNVGHIAKEVNEGLSCKHGSSRGVSGESNSMDVMDSFISSCGGDQDLEEDEVYDYDGYETQFGDQFISVSWGHNRN
ncbi:hypothetical protein Tco_1452126, partial [Tanacetum coccineum]